VNALDVRQQLLYRNSVYVVWCCCNAACVTDVSGVAPTNKLCSCTLAQPLVGIRQQTTRCTQTRTHAALLETCLTAAVQLCYCRLTPSPCHPPLPLQAISQLPQLMLLTSLTPPSKRTLHARTHAALLEICLAAAVHI
jgi:hypothetical protein